MTELILYEITVEEKETLTEWGRMLSSEKNPS